MELYDREQQQAVDCLRAQGRAPGDFSFEVSFLPPDPEAGAMFTMRYEVVVTHTPNGKSLVLLGGIGLEWVGTFESAVREGHFD